MPTVRLSFSPEPAHVRTARLVGVAVARRAGVADELIEEIRLAIGEACSRAVALHRAGGLAHMVDVAMTDGERFTVRVTDRAPKTAGLGTAPADPETFLDEPGVPLSPPGSGKPNGPLTEEAVAAGVGLALLAGLVDDLKVAA